MLVTRIKLCPSDGKDKVSIDKDLASFIVGLIIMMDEEQM